MRIKHLSVSGFRGIRRLEWTIEGDCVCLIGPGDSMKSTILDAIEMVFSPRWSIAVSDSDFHNGDPTIPIEIIATVGHLPESLIDEAKFGLELRGWDQQRGLCDEPEEGCEPVLSVRLRIPDSLEPEWRVVNNRNPEGRPIPFRDRELLGVARLGEFGNRHLGWSKGSVLLRLAEQSRDLSGVIAEAARSMRRATDLSTAESLLYVAKKAEAIGREIGVVAMHGYQPGLDIGSATPGTNSIVLFDGPVPVRNAGLGTRRLLALGLQREILKQGALILVDEVEYGLEPHRLRQLLNILRTDASPAYESTASKAKSRDYGQVFMTSHSPVVALELDSTHLNVVGAKSGCVEVRNMGNYLQDIVRRTPEALVAHRIIVCEGRTEQGAMRALDTAWGLRDSRSFAYLGVVPVDGGGDNAPRTSLELARLGYHVSYLGDSDCSIDPDAEELTANGVLVVRWEGGLAFEQRLAMDLPWKGVVDMVNIAIGALGQQSIRDQVACQHGTAAMSLALDPSEWIESQALREAIGKSAKKGKWLKRMDLGEQVGNVIGNHFGDLQGTDLGTKLTCLWQWTRSD